ncbi:NAD(P)H-hydrate dehydratase [Herminiimonas fonticola]|uniref:Bifunctional NAD(P)H-hydrate repair enzyme n=1 Tax=Herminiimonas fonticola TaxID=303380 RepID=A0A4R6G1N9_9BURK|nr:NAD(P)H-hydrate dehydratase [Herminiimonas fonticola]RBA23454.1 YjeF family C-terminal domain [Herminiimonas fonticola]TDN88291.1 hydroxyethylthiazole kinase-like uncharacterized protein yjeF/hydroxyethylthiazole kinase-like uncharacterized protein yjeF [Herminiimonas fonticola]
MPSSLTLYTVAEIRQIEQAAFAILPSYTLMQRAGTAAANYARHLLADHDYSAAILVLVGPGNNGGDALEAASQLAQSGWNVKIYLSCDPARLPADAQQALLRAQNSPAHFIDENISTQNNWALVVDGLFGIGLTRAITGEISALIEQINTLHCPVLALDVPSGLDANTGAIIGANITGKGDSNAIRATHTITFIANKAGLHTCDGRDYAGEVHVSDLGLDADLFPPSSTHLNQTELFASALQYRRHNSHKGSYGDVLVLGGAQGMLGAAVLAARTAAKSGAGRVFLACIAEHLNYDSMQPELMCRDATDVDFNNATIVAGPGLGTSRAAHDFLARALAAHTPLVLDADALNLIAVEAGLQQKLATRKAHTLLTPHPLEAARLLGITTSQIQADRLAAARALAKKFNATTILKGSGSVIAVPDGTTVINTTGNPALATAGAGDVLSGLCGALLAQNWPLWEAALAAVWLHGKAADNLVTNGIGPIGLTASELIPEIRSALNQLVSRQNSAQK